MGKEIYIKRGPSKSKLNYEEARKALETSSPNFDELERYLKESNISFETFIENAFMFNGSKYDFKHDWTGCENFWTSKQAENGIIMVEETLSGKGIKKGYKSEEVLDNDFIKLSDFIKNGTYIGKYFRRTKLIYKEDKELLSVNHNIFILFENDGVLLSIRPVDDKAVFGIVPKKYTEDGNYELYGCQKISYNDVKKINKAIVKQLTNNK